MRNKCIGWRGITFAMRSLYKSFLGACCLFALYITCQLIEISPTLLAFTRFLSVPCDPLEVVVVLWMEVIPQLILQIILFMNPALASRSKNDIQTNIQQFKSHIYLNKINLISAQNVPISKRTFRRKKSSTRSHSHQSSHVENMEAGS